MLPDGRHVDIPGYYEDNDRSHRGAAKLAKVMREFKHKTLHSSSGAKVTSRKQAIAIALSEAGLSRKKKKH